MSTQFLDDSVSDESRKKPSMILEYNRTKGRVDNADKLVREYSCARRTSRWPLRLFMNMLDIGALNAFIIWMLKNKDWNQRKPNRRYRFLLELGKELTNPNILRRASNPMVSSFQLSELLKLRECMMHEILQLKAHHQHLGSSRAARGEDAYIVLEATTRKSAQSALNANILSVRTQEDQHNCDMC
jgi:hypothetical protein